MEQAQRAFYRPRLGDGAVGRAGERRLHRRHDDRRRPRPQRPAAEPLLGDRRRPRRDGVRGRRHRHRPVQGGHQGSIATGADVPHRHRRWAHRRRLRDQGHARRRTPLPAVARRRARRVRRPAGASTSCSATTACCLADGCSATRTRSSRSSSPRWPSTPTNRSGRWARTRSPCCRSGRACFSTTSRSCSPRSQPCSMRFARRSSPRWRRRSDRGEPAGARPGELPATRPAVPDHRQRRAGQDPPRQLRRVVPGTAAKHIKGLYRVAGGGLALERALNAICAEVSAAIEDGVRVIVLSDRNSDAVEAPIPSLL